MHVGTRLVVLAAVAGCKHDAPPPPPPSPQGSATVTAPRAVTVPSHPSTSLRIRVVTARGESKDPQYPSVLEAIALCRPDEQLTGGSCDTDHKPTGYAVNTTGRRLDDDAHTFGAGWYCSDTRRFTAQAFCLSDPSNVPAEAAPPDAK